MAVEDTAEVVATVEDMVVTEETLAEAGQDRVADTVSINIPIYRILNLVFFRSWRRSRRWWIME